MRILYIALSLALLSYTVIVQAETLFEVYQQAKQQDPELQKAYTNFLLMSERKNEIKGSLLPQVSANGQYGYFSNQEKNQHPFSQKTKSTGQYWQGNIQLKQILFNKAQWLKLSIQDQRIEQARIALAYAQQNLIYLVSYHYLNVLKSEEQLNSIQAEKKALQQHLINIKQQLKYGQVSNADMQQIQARFDKAQADEILAQNLVNNNLESLAELTNQTPKKLLKLNNQKFKKLSLKPFDSYYQQAKQANLVFIQQQIAVELAKQQIDLVKAEHYPTLNLAGNLSHSQRKEHNQINHPNQQKTNQSFIGIEIQIPLYSGGQIVSQTEQQRLSYKESLIELDKQQRLLRKELHTLVNSLKALDISIKAYQQARLSATSSYQATQAEYELGVKNLVDLLNALQVNYQAQADLTNAKYDYLIAVLKLKQLTGRLTEKDIDELNNYLTQK